MLQFYLFMLQSMKIKRECLVHYCVSLMGCRFQMLWDYTFVFGDIGYRRKKLQKPKKTYFLKKKFFSSPE